LGDKIPKLEKMDIYLYYQEIGVDDYLLDEISRLLSIGDYEPFQLANKYSDKRLTNHVCQSKHLLLGLEEAFEYLLVERLGFVLGHLLECTSGVEFIWAVENLRLSGEEIAAILIESPKTLQLLRDYLGCWLIGRQDAILLPSVEDILSALDPDHEDVVKILLGDDCKAYVEHQIASILESNPQDIVVSEQLRNDLLGWIDLLESFD